MIRLPILRKGRPYTSLSRTVTPHFRTRQPFVEISLANPGLIRRDLLDAENTWAIMQGFRASELITITKRAAEIYKNDTLPLGDTTQTPQEYVEQISATTGLPFVMVRKNMNKIYGVMAEIDTVISGLTRGMDLSVLDEGHGQVGGHAVSFFARGFNLGAVLPNLGYAADAHYHHLADDLIVGGPMRYEGGAIRVPDTPGLGVELDREKLRRYGGNTDYRDSYARDFDYGRRGPGMRIYIGPDGYYGPGRY